MPEDGEQVATSGKLYLLTLEQFNALPEGTKLVTIFGKRRVVGQHEYHGDDRWGYASWGILESELPGGLQVDQNATIEITPLRQEEE